MPDRSTVRPLTQRSSTPSRLTPSTITCGRSPPCSATRGPTASTSSIRRSPSVSWFTRASPCSFVWKPTTPSTTRSSRLLRPPRRTSRSAPSRRPLIVSVRFKLAPVSCSKYVNTSIVGLGGPPAPFFSRSPPTHRAATIRERGTTHDVPACRCRGCFVGAGLRSLTVAARRRRALPHEVVTAQRNVAPLYDLVEPGKQFGDRHLLVAIERGPGIHDAADQVLEAFLQDFAGALRRFGFRALAQFLDSGRHLA